MSGRKQRALIAKETVGISEAGHYRSPGGKSVGIGDELSRAKAETVHYAPEQFPRVLRRSSKLVAGLEGDSAPKLAVVNRTTLAAARDLWNESPEDVCCLNFASAKNPGGGFLNGSQAQEESLARASGLYACIAPQRVMYDTNRANASCLYSDHMLYSPEVPVFRDDEDVLLEEPYLVSFLTVPAVNAGAVQRKERHRVEPTMRSRMEKLLAVAVVHEHRRLVLGAWGCGVFRNDPAMVAELFRFHLTENDRFRGAFDKVVFAVLDGSVEGRFIKPFEECFPS